MDASCRIFEAWERKVHLVGGVCVAAVRKGQEWQVGPRLGKLIVGQRWVSSLDLVSELMLLAAD